MDLTVSTRDIKVTVRDVISVQDDTNTQVVEFLFDRKEVSYDLTTLNPFVLYKTASDQGARFEICTKTFNDDEIRVQWTIRKPVTYAQGKLEFQVVFTDTADPITYVSDKRWATKIATVSIPRTLSVENYAIDPEPIVEQMMGIATQVTNKVDAASSSAKLASQRAEEAKASAEKAEDAARRAEDSITSKGNRVTVGTNQPSNPLVGDIWI